VKLEVRGRYDRTSNYPNMECSASKRVEGAENDLELSSSGARPRSMSLSARGWEQGAAVETAGCMGRGAQGDVLLVSSSSLRNRSRVSPVRNVR
jgi:hypothetical protein